MKLKRVLYDSRIAEVDTIAGQIISAYSDNNLADDANLAKIMADITSRRGAMQSAIQQTDSESNLESMDIIRDEKYKAVAYIITGATYNPSKIIKESGDFLQGIFDKYGLSVANMSYNEESSNIINLIGELKTADSVASSSKVAGLSLAIDQLESAQNQFDEAATAWKSNKGDDNAEVSPSQIRKELLLVINKNFIPYLNVMVMVNSDTYSQFAKAASVIINDNNENVKRRNR